MISTHLLEMYRIEINVLYKIIGGLGSSVGTATDYGLGGPGIESWWDARFSAVQAGPPRLLHDGYRVFPRGKKRPGRDADPSPPSSAEV